jgi:hypothetical protein
MALNLGRLLRYEKRVRLGFDNFHHIDDLFFPNSMAHMGHRARMKKEASHFPRHRVQFRYCRHSCAAILNMNSRYALSDRNRVHSDSGDSCADNHDDYCDGTYYFDDDGRNGD